MTPRLVLVAVLLSPIAYADRAPVPPAPGPNAGAPAPAVVAPMPARRPPPPRPAPAPTPTEIATHGKAIAGTYKCKGNQPTGTGASVPLEATLAIKLDLDSAWISSSWISKTGKLADFRTYDATSHQWTRVQLGSDTSHSQFTSLGEKNGEWLWEGPTVAPTGTTQERHHEQFSAKELTLWGEAQLGGTWQKTYAVSCKR